MNKLITVSMTDGKIETDQLGDQKYRKDVALLIPLKDLKHYKKHTIEATVNTLQDVTVSLRPNQSRVSFEEAQQGKTDDGIHEELMATVKDLSNLMQRIVHSASWRDGELHEFDQYEIERQLTSISQRVKQL